MVFHLNNLNCWLLFFPPFVECLYLAKVNLFKLAADGIDREWELECGLNMRLPVIIQFIRYIANDGFKNVSIYKRKILPASIYENFDFEILRRENKVEVDKISIYRISRCIREHIEWIRNEHESCPLTIFSQTMLLSLMVYVYHHRVKK